jgi:hypothetical protein
MDKGRRLLAWLLLGVLVSFGCASMEGVRAKNRENLVRLSRGMTKAEVLNVMGVKTVKTGSGLVGTLAMGLPPGQRITNPWRVETHEAGGFTWEILYYYTDVKKADGAITDDELTPIVIKDGKLDGWGWSYLNDVAAKYEIRIR